MEACHTDIVRFLPHMLLFAHFARMIDRDRSPLETAALQSQSVTIKAGKPGIVVFLLKDNAICVSVEWQHGKAIHPWTPLFL